MTIVQEVKDAFPDLELCVLAQKRRGIIHDEIDKYRSHIEMSVWIAWFENEGEDFEWLRIKLKSGLSLIIKRLKGSHYLIVLNSVENLVQLLAFLKRIKSPKAAKNEAQMLNERTLSDVKGDIDLKIKDAVRIQKLIIPKEEDIRKLFRQFFVVHQQQDVVGGDFYWYQNKGDEALLALVDCTGHSVEGAMTSMVCNSLLNQAVDVYKREGLKGFVANFYEKLYHYNQASEDKLDYGIGADLGIFNFNFFSKKVEFITTGVSAFVKKKSGIALLRNRGLRDHDEMLTEFDLVMLDMQEIKGIYIFTDGLTDQYDSSDKKKLGYKGVQHLIEQEAHFEKDYYAEQINRWKGKNMQYDDITLLGVAI